MTRIAFAALLSFCFIQLLAARTETLTEKQVITITIYEDSDPATLAKEVGAMYGMNDGQVSRLSSTIEKEMVSRMKLRTTVDLTKYGVGQQTLVIKKDVRSLAPPQCPQAQTLHTCAVHIMLTWLPGTG